MCPYIRTFSKYLRVAERLGTKNFHFQYQALPFGITIAPRIFTKIVAEMSAHLREKEGILIPYLDDVLLVGKSESAVKNQIDLQLDVLQNFGWLINWEKSHLAPLQKQKFLGMILDSRERKYFLPREKIEVIQNSITNIRVNPKVTVT